MRWAEHVEGSEEKRNHIYYWWESHKEKEH
jgi:hypothetical protein